MPSAVLRVRDLGSVARDGVEVEGRRQGVEKGKRGQKLEVRLQRLSALAKNARGHP